MSCLDEIRKAYPQLTDSEAKRLVAEMKGLQDAYKHDLTLYNKMLGHTLNEAELRAAQLAKDSINDNIKTMRNLKRVYDPNTVNRPIEGALSLYEASPYPIKDAARNIDFISGTNSMKYRTQMIQDFKSKNLLRQATSGKMDREVMSEMFERGKPDYKPHANDQIVRIADTYTKINNGLLEMQQNAGSSIKAHQGYIFKQSHDLVKIRKDVDAWVETIVPHLDLTKSFGLHDIHTPGGLAKSREVARTVLTDMTKDLETMDISSPISLTGGKRELIFKSGENFYDYNKIYGYNTLFEGIGVSIERASKQAAMVEILGSNPRAAHNNLKDLIKKITPQSKDVASHINKLDSAWDYVTGVGNRPGYGVAQTAFDISRIRKKLLYLELLGQSGFTALNDFANILVTLKTADGTNAPFGMLKMFTAAMEALPPGGKVKFAETMHIALDESRFSIQNWVKEGQRPGLLSKAVDFQMLVNGTRPVTAWTRQTAAILHANSLTKTLTKKGRLGSFEAITVKTSGLTDPEIDTLRGLKKNTGSRWITPKLVRDASFKDLGVADNIAGRKYKERLENKLGAYYNIVVSDASPMPGARQMRQARKHLRQDDPTRLAWDLITTLKMTLLRAGNTTEKMMRATGPDGRMVSAGSIANLAQFVVAGGMLSYIRMQAKNAAMGRKLEEPTVNNMKDALIDSGVMGVYVDTVLGNYYQYGRSTMDRVGGPILSDIGEILVMAQKGATGDLKQKELMRNIKRRIPYQNLWLLPAVKEHMLKR